MSLDKEAWDRLREMVPAGEEARFFGELIALFVATTPPIIAELTAALAVQDVAGVHDHAHRLKGMCQGLGVVELGDIASRLEMAARTGGALAGTKLELGAAFALAAEDLKRMI